MKDYRQSLISACWLILLPFSVAAQNPSTPPVKAPAPTPDSENKTKSTAQPNQVDPELQLELGASYEHLSNGAGDWQSYFLAFNRKFASRQTLYGSASIVRRFDLTDPYFMVGYVQPFGESQGWSATIEASGSPRHQFLPEVSIYGQIERNFGAGWLGHAALRYSRYNNDADRGRNTNNVNLSVFGVEKYFKQYRAAYSLFVGKLNGRGTSASHVFQGNYYYGERNSFGLGVAFGQEIESVGEGRLIRTDVTNLSLNGRHWMNERWGFSYVAVWHRQGALYTRSGPQIGLLLKF